VAYEEELVVRIREMLGDDAALTEKRMFGGLAFLINGNMSVSASSRGGLLLRVDPDQTDALVDEPHAERMVMRGRPMDGWLRIATEGVQSAVDLRRWVDRGVGYARTLQPKA
jgi:TfoX/Sxy family transcriptional regulator of competence genes